jgi:hypothetical protein
MAARRGFSVVDALGDIFGRPIGDLDRSRAMLGYPTDI